MELLPLIPFMKKKNAAGDTTTIMGRWHVAFSAPNSREIFSPVVYRKSDGSTLHFPSTDPFLILLRPYTVPFSILRKRQEPKEQPQKTLGCIVLISLV